MSTDLSLPGFALSPIGLQVEGDPTFEQWEAAGHFLQRIESGSTWWVGDWLRHGEGRPEWGEGYGRAIAVFNRDYQTLANYKSVAAKIEFSRRRENLSWAHHAEVAACEVAEQERLLDLAESKKLSREKLRLEVRKTRIAVRGEAPPLPDGKFNVVLADPPWRYEHNEADNRAIEWHYPTMELAEICALPIQESCADDCVLFCWATSPKLAEAMQVVASWGFLYRTCAVWLKDKIGMGYYWRQQHELLLLAIKGNPRAPFESTRQPSVFEAPRCEHSRKPDLVYGMVEQMFPEAKYLELFCRRPRPGWTAWGNEIQAEAA
jgi:N6-adenosine-specific RNA methylase IME4